MSALPAIPGGVPPEAMLPRRFRLRQRQAELRDTFTLTLEAVEGGEVMSFLPGQFAMLYVFGVGEIPVSISGDPGQPERLVHTVRAVGAVSRGLERLRVGEIVGVRGPYGSAWPVAEAAGEDLLLIAGGLGLAPLRPVLAQVATQRPSYGRVLLLLGARSPEEILYFGELEHWRAHGIEVEVTVDRVPFGGERWPGHVGVVTTLLGKTTLHPRGGLTFVCGPEVMMHFTVLELLQRGFAPERIYLSLERNMKCAIGLCGHCQFSTVLVCRDGPVLCYERLRPFFHKREI